MNLFENLDQIVKTDVSLAEYTWYKLGGPAKYFIEPDNYDQLLDVIKRCHENNIDIYVLGGGSNLLIDDAGVDGAVVSLSSECFKKIEFNGDIVKAGAGVSMSHLLRESARQGLGGMECMAGIPGTVGGALKINAGGRFGDIGSLTKSVDLIDSSGYEFTWQANELYFGYRMSNITARFITAAEFHLAPDDPERIGQLIKEVWMLKKSSQPMDTRNAGCVFKNPRAMSAGALIDKAGLKGTRVGGAIVSERHANFIVVESGATSKDVLELIDLVIEKINERFGVELELELQIWK